MNEACHEKISDVELNEVQDGIAVHLQCRVLVAIIYDFVYCKISPLTSLDPDRPQISFMYKH